MRQCARVSITLLYFDGCPNWVEADHRLREALGTLGLANSVIEYRRVETPEAAVAGEFRGSPTILVDGRDPFDPGSVGFGLSCRVYATPEGLQGAPTVKQLISAMSQ